jgi:uncharacterized protein YjbJ (UPF0337 family)
MYVTEQTEFDFACINLNERWEQHFTLKVIANNYQETHMNKYQIKGRIEEAKGKVKEAAGVILDDEALEVEGNVQKNVGKVQSGFGDLKEDIKDSI